MNLEREERKGEQDGEIYYGIGCWDDKQPMHFV